MDGGILMHISFAANWDLGWINHMCGRPSSTKNKKLSVFIMNQMMPTAHCSASTQSPDFVPALPLVCSMVDIVSAHQPEQYSKYNSQDLQDREVADHCSANGLIWSRLLPQAVNSLTFWSLLNIHLVWRENNKTFFNSNLLQSRLQLKWNKIRQP